MRQNKLLILYGTQTGNSKALATDLYQIASKKSVDTDILNIQNK